MSLATAAKPRYEILAKMAELYKEGGCDLEQVIFSFNKIIIFQSEIGTKVVFFVLGNLFFFHQEIYPLEIIKFIFKNIILMEILELVETFKEKCILPFIQFISGLRASLQFVHGGSRNGDREYEGEIGQQILRRGRNVLCLLNEKMVTMILYYFISWLF